MDITALRPYLEATAMGLGVGFEREWRSRGEEQQTAGSRTFAVLGLAGAVAARMGSTVVAAGTVGVAALLVAGYVRTAGRDRGTTTEAAALATFLLGALMRSDAELAIGLAVVMVALLAAKGPIHRLAREVVTATELEDALRFFVVAFVVLPLLPDRKLGPYGVLNPSRIWVLVVALTGIGWAGYIAVRALGVRRGLLITGLAGGFISAAATTASLGRLARRHPAALGPAVTGALMASGATLVQLGLVTAVANIHLLGRLLPTLAAGLAAVAAEAGLLYWRSSRQIEAGEVRPEAAGIGRGRPFTFWPAVGLAGLLTLLLLGSRWGADVLGSQGVLLAAALGGLADAHAPVLAVATLASGGAVGLGTALAATGLSLGANTISKCALAFAAGGRTFGASFTAVLVLPVAAVATALVVSAT